MDGQAVMQTYLPWMDFDGCFVLWCDINLNLLAA